MYKRHTLVSLNANKVKVAYNSTMIGDRQYLTFYKMINYTNFYCHTYGNKIKFTNVLYRSDVILLYTWQARRKSNDFFLAFI